MQVITVTTLVLPGGEIPPGSVIKIPDHFLPRLAGKVEPIGKQVWLEGDDLRTKGYVPDLSGEIVKLTEGNLPLQKILLRRHCEEYDHHHLWRLVECVRRELR
ncbi:MAG: hypothetical protein VB050_04920 [Geobacteraceae bacterium]|nr:hypothetical protein [Geobacteraceae bacterium]